MRVNYASVPPETPPATGQPPPSKTPRRRIYVALGIIAVVAVAIALTFAFTNVLNLNPSGTESTIPLSYNYAPGEEMTYNMNETINDAGQNTSITGTFSLDVISFDGTNYIINFTTTVRVPTPDEASTLSSTVTEKMNKAGYVTVSNGMNGTQCPLFGNPFLYFQKDKATVGETWQVPLSFGNQTVSYNGNFTYTFGNIQTITVPAGTYKVFALNISSNDLTVIMGGTTKDLTVVLQNVTAQGQVYIEYGTCRLIDSNIQEIINYTSGSINYDETITEQTTLTNLTKP
jgi:hypothetical protein